MDLNQTWTHINLWLLLEKFGQNSPGIYLPQAENQFWTLTKHTFATDHDINSRKRNFINLKGLPTFHRNLVTFGPETAENGRRVFAHP